MSTRYDMRPGGINYVRSQAEMDALCEAMAASRLAADFKAATGNPIIVTPNQMKYFKEAGVDTANLALNEDLSDGAMT